MKDDIKKREELLRKIQSLNDKLEILKAELRKLVLAR